MPHISIERERGAEKEKVKLEEVLVDPAGKKFKVGRPI